jgi:hypothetical protein
LALRVRKTTSKHPRIVVAAKAGIDFDLRAESEMDYRPLLRAISLRRRFASVSAFAVRPAPE